jgi:hypothetical protein
MTALQQDQREEGLAKSEEAQTQESGSLVTDPSPGLPHPEAPHLYILTGSL